MFYSVVLFGNRIGATIGKDYAVAECATYSKARQVLVSNGNWGNIKEFNTYADCLKSNNDFILEVRAQCLSVKHIKHVCPAENNRKLQAIARGAK
jgi:hypothetical protein